MSRCSLLAARSRSSLPLRSTVPTRDTAHTAHRGLVFSRRLVEHCWRACIFRRPNTPREPISQRAPSAFQSTDAPSAIDGPSRLALSSPPFAESFVSSESNICPFRQLPALTRPRVSVCTPWPCRSPADHAPEYFSPLALKKVPSPSLRSSAHCPS